MAKELTREFSVPSGATVHIWVAHLDEFPPTALGTCWECLALAERDRAERLRFPHGRERFVLRRGLLRLLLGRYLKVPAEAIVFCHNEYGKPGLAASLGRSGLTFSLSHSEGTAVYAVAGGLQLGIDVERIREDIAAEAIAGRFFSRLEQAELARIERGCARQAFFTCWTRKEAFVKAKGVGLSLALASFDVSVRPGEPPALLCVRSPGVDAKRWSLRDLDVGSDFCAALAVRATQPRLFCRALPAGLF